MRFPERRKRVMARSIALNHCICNPKQPCPCETFNTQNLCPCAGERPDPTPGSIQLTKTVRKAGCASKISQADLQRVLSQLPTYDDPNVLVGIAAGDDAGVYRIGGDFDLVQTVDVFSPVVDDPYTFGQICAANSVSDIYAMGARPICALSIIGFPIETLPGEVMSDILRGGIDKMREAGVSVIGGHSINDEELKCGFAVTGLIRGTGMTTDAARPGDALVLTKPLGVGIVSFAAQIGRVSNEAVELIGLSMAELNQDAAELMIEHGAHACTDVTGFSLMGHLVQMVRHSGVSAEIDMASVPVFAEALACAKAGIIPGAVERNLESFAGDVFPNPDTNESLFALLFDAQTSGGLLVSLPEEKANAYIQAMRERGRSSVSRIGKIVNKNEHCVKVNLGEPTQWVGTYREPSRAEKTPPLPPVNASCCAGGEHEFAASRAEMTPPLPPTLPSPAIPQEIGDAFKQFSQAANAPNAIDARNKKLMAIALSIATRCEPCLKIHLQSTLAQGMPWTDIEEAAWMAIFFSGAPAKMFYEKIKQEMIGTKS